MVVALVTMGLKTLAWWLTGSVGLLSDAMESVVNLAGALFGLWMVTIAARPADADHPYGHHKAEYFSAGVEGILVVVAAIGILWAAGSRLLHPQPLESLNLGLALSVLASVLNGTLAWLMLQAARVHRSAALEGEAHHLFSDVWTTAGVLLGLLLVGLTGWPWLDPLLAAAVALQILYSGVRLVWRSTQGLMDKALDAAELERVQGVLTTFASPQTNGDSVYFDHLVTRQAGRRHYMDVHMHLPADWTLAQAAALRAEVEHALGQAVEGLYISIQVLPHAVEPAHTLHV